LVYCKASLRILWVLGLVCWNLGYVFPFWYAIARKIWQP
jgi:predicted acyltransferase